MKHPDWFDGAEKLHRRIFKGRRVYDDKDTAHLIIGLVGEAGEVANELKKLMRSGYTPAARKKFLKNARLELADTRIYLELVVHALKFDLDEAVVEKRKIVERRWAKKVPK